MIKVLVSFIIFSSTQSWAEVIYSGPEKIRFYRQRYLPKMGFGFFESDGTFRFITDYIVREEDENFKLIKRQRYEMQDGNTPYATAYL
jgi:hypothetical protein